MNQRSSFAMLLDVLSRPGRSVQFLSVHQPAGLAFLALALSRVSRSLAFYLTLHGPTTTFAPAFDIVFGMAFDFFLACCLAAFCHFALGLMGAQGRPQSLLWALLVGQAPQVLACPGALAARYALVAAPETYLKLLGVLYLGLFLWSLALTVHLISAQYQCPGGTSLSAYFVAWGIGLLGICLCYVSFWMLAATRFIYLTTLS